MEATSTDYSRPNGSTTESTEGRLKNEPGGTGGLHEGVEADEDVVQGVAGGGDAEAAVEIDG